MVHATCAVENCRSSSYINKNLKFHQFPRTEERCTDWIHKCGRPDLLEKGIAGLKNSYVCSLHFEPKMYGKKFLKKTSVPSLLLPSSSSHITNNSNRDIPQKQIQNTLIRSIPESSISQWRDSNPVQEKVTVANDDTLPHASLTMAKFTLNSSKRKLSETLQCPGKRPKMIYEEDEGITEQQFLKSCDDFLPSKLSAIVKLHIHLKPHCKNWFTKDFKLFCLNIFFISPLAYRFLSKTLHLPSKTTLANLYLPMSELNKQTWAVLSTTAKHMSSRDRECTLCMGLMSLKSQLFCTKSGKVIGLHEVDGEQRPIVAGYAFTLMLRGITSNWKQTVGCIFISTRKIDEKLTNWILDTLKKLFNLGYSIRAVVSDRGSDFMSLSKSLGITEDNPVFNIEGRKLYYIFDYPNLIKSFRNNLITCNFEFEGKTVKWEDIENLGNLDKKMDTSHNSFQKQNRFAAQAFDNSVVAALHSHVASDNLEIASGTVDFFEMMNSLIKLLNSGNWTTSKLLTGSTSQIEVLERAQNVFRNLNVKNKTTGHDVTTVMKFSNAILITIHSFRLLLQDLQRENYDYLLTRRLNNDCVKNLFGLIRQAGGGREPNCIQFLRAYRKILLCQLLRLSDEMNCKEDFDSILEEYLRRVL